MIDSKINIAYLMFEKEKKVSYGTEKGQILNTKIV